MAMPHNGRIRDAVIRMHGKGSASFVANELRAEGIHLTRNAIIGIWNRAGIHQSPDQKEAEAKARMARLELAVQKRKESAAKRRAEREEARKAEVRKPKVEEARPIMYKPPPPQADVVDAFAEIKPRVPGGVRINLTQDFPVRDCREVIGADHDGVALMCSRPSVGKTFFCLGHCRINYSEEGRRRMGL